jgi:hypothetical protein
MKKILLLAMVIELLIPHLCFSQSDALTYQPSKDKKVIDSKFILVSSYLVAMTVFDVETTFAAVRNGAHETNPVMKPFVKSGRPATYGISLGIDAAFLLLAYEMKKSSNVTLNKTWWVLPSMAATGHGIAGGMNLRYCW